MSPAMRNRQPVKQSYAWDHDSGTSLFKLKRQPGHGG